MHADPLEASLALFPHHEHAAAPNAAAPGSWSRARLASDRLSLSGSGTSLTQAPSTLPDPAGDPAEIRPRRHRVEFVRAEAASRVQALRAKQSGGALAYCRAWALAQGALVFARYGNVPPSAPLHTLADQTGRRFETICPGALSQAREHLAAARSEDCASRTTRLYAVRKHFERVIDLATAVPYGRLDSLPFREAQPRYELLLAAHRGLAAMALPDEPQHLRDAQRIAAHMTMHALHEKTAGFCFPRLPPAAALPRWPNPPRLPALPAVRHANHDMPQPEPPPSMNEEFAF